MSARLIASLLALAALCATAAAQGDARLSITSTESCVLTADLGNNFRFFIEKDIPYTFTFTGVTTSECEDFDPAQGLAFSIKNTFGNGDNLCQQTDPCVLDGSTYTCVATDVVFPASYNGVETQPCGSTRPIIYCANTATVTEGPCGNSAFAGMGVGLDILPDPSYNPNPGDTSTHLIPATFPQGCEQGTQDVTCANETHIDPCDGVVCPTNTSCVQYYCEPSNQTCIEIHTNCDDDNECTTDSCDPAEGCQHTNVTCNDNNACTDDSCDPATGCVYTNISAACDDEDACTADSCDIETGCVHENISSTCNDDNHCTLDSCDPETGCVNTPITCNDSNACTIDTCVPATGCVYTPSVDCDDDNECTLDSCDPTSGCTHTPITCNDSNACTTDTCDPATGCVYTPITNGCDDDDECTLDSCDPATGCTHTPITCNDSNACTVDSCDPETGCTYTTIVCNDSNSCTIDTCDPATGCVYTPSIDCDDDNKCTVDSCDPDTGCTHTPIVCNDSNACTTDTCDPQSGCVYTDISSTCDDSNDCTADRCDPDEGCVNTPITCDDSNPCTIDTCLPDGGCVYTPVDCDDGDDCTIDSCDGLTGQCKHTRIDSEECFLIPECPPGAIGYIVSPDCTEVTIISGDSTSVKLSFSSGIPGCVPQLAP